MPVIVIMVRHLKCQHVVIQWVTQCMHTNVEYTIIPPGRANWTAWSNILLWYFAWFLKDSIVSCQQKN